PPLRSLEFLPNYLPVQLTSFIGREREKAEIKRLLRTTRLLSLTGAGGAGKTRLALQVGAEVLDEFRDGVWLVELAAVSDSNLVPPAVAAALNVPEQVGRPLTETLANHLKTKSALLIIDNCEHLVVACAHLTHTLLRACPDLRILATSREALRLTGETTWLVPSLSSPDPQHLPPLDRFKEYEAVRLFIERAAARSPEFAVTCSNRPGVALLCHRLDGMPLAIELAAVRVKVLAVDQIAARLDDRFRSLTGGSRTGLLRHQTLRATMDWSYDLLSASERALLRRLSVFAGGWLLEAAEAICSGDHVETADILNLQGQLVDKSLVSVDAQNSEVRYWMLEMVRQYGRERLVEAGEAPEFLTRHRDWYLALAEQADRELPGARQQMWLQRLETEHDNLRAGLTWSKTDAHGAETALRLAGALQWFWADRGYWSEAREWLEGALARGGDAPPAAAAKPLQAATFFALQQGDCERAIALGQKGRALCETLGDKENAAMLLTWLGNVAILQGDHERATELLGNGLDICRALGKPWLTSMVLAHLGRVVRYEGDFDRAAALHRQSLALARKAEDQSLIALSLYNLGMDILRGDDPQLAAEHFRQSLVICRDVGNTRITEECLKGLAGVACAQPLPKRAACLFGAAQRLRDLIGFRPSDQAYHDERAASARAALGQPAFDAAWADGRAMTLEQAIEYALGHESD
ncbi:MAG TPA: tetratricopeptide repeat protein, partial [Methylomirabilota bacterium]|nr:tetratricopeptide repeat protein [Methylomirabilota bacterium]